MYESRRDELRHLERCMQTARSRDEHDYYRSRLYEAERRLHMNQFYDEPKRVMPMPPPLTLAPDPVTPLTFLKTADKKLLLTGATT